MKHATLRNFHLPLSEDLYTRLRAEAEHLNQPATTLAREAIELWLRQRRKSARYEAIASYAGRHAGSDVDLDPELEAVSVEHWLDEEKR